MSVLRQLHHIFTVRQAFSESLCYGRQNEHIVAMCRRGVLNLKSKRFFGIWPLTLIVVILMTYANYHWDLIRVCKSQVVITEICKICEKSPQIASQNLPELDKLEPRYGICKINVICQFSVRRSTETKNF